MGVDPVAEEDRRPRHSVDRARRLQDRAGHRQGRGADPGQAENRKLFVELDVKDQKPFVQSDVPVTVRIYDSVGVRSGALEDPTADGATFTRQGDQRAYDKTIGGRRYRVIEQDYLMQPQRSGKIEIPAISLQANVPGDRRAGLPPDMAQLLGSSGFDMSLVDSAFDPGRNVTVRSNPVDIDVQSRPADAKGWFLPARQVKLTETWSPDLAKARVGDTLTRKIRLEAVGAGLNQLPPLTMTDVAGVRQYEEASQTNSVPSSQGQTAVLDKTISVVPTAAGTVSLPPVEVGWWNTKTGKAETATLPAVTLNVAPAANGASAAPAPTAAPAAATPAPAPVAAEPPPVATDADGGILAYWKQSPHWQLGLAAALAVIAGAAVALARFSRRSGVPAAVAERREAFAEEGAERSIAQDLEAACRTNDAPRAHRAFLAWARHAGYKPGASDFRTPQLQAAADGLQRRLYAPEAGTWDGAGFLAAWRAEQKARGKADDAAAPRGLMPLYPKLG
ncbi:protein BatD [Rhizobiales bacterium Sp-1]|uniref:Protein BatD n=1 Tax=Segnochrobactrum spirostomi TaxID=2608987 RepID=A0A6A7Y6U7_9HYPH|nr:protein BatD [Segnochrobactrum spirostomi]